MARKPWKALVADGLLQLALVLSILRADIPQYLRDYSTYPEIQQVLLGESVGLNLVDNYHHNEFIYPSKYSDDSDLILSELNRLTQSTQFIRPVQFLPTYLVTEGASSVQVSRAPRQRISAELTTQDADEIERLWKQDINSLDAQPSHTISQRVSVTENEPVDNFALFQANGPNHTSFPPHEQRYQTQTSLEYELEGLDVLNNTMVPYLGGNTSSPYLHMDVQPAVGGAGSLGQDSALGFMSASEDEMMDTDDHLNPSITEHYDISSLAQLDIDDIDLDPFLFPSSSSWDSLSEDSAVSLGSGSPLQDLLPDTNSIFTPEDAFTPDEAFAAENAFTSDEAVGGAIGYTGVKLEPYDYGFYDESLDMQSVDKRIVAHDHTYGAPPGGVPHVRKMDIKVLKEPSRGFAHDEVMCKKLKIPFSINQIIDSAVEDFNALLHKYPLSSRQMNLVKDIRRRGKNKVAAQNCRKKKIVELTDLDEEVVQLRTKRDNYLKMRSQLTDKSTEIRKHIDIMSAEIFSTLRDENGIPYNRSQYSLEVNSNGEVTVSVNSRKSRTKKMSDKRRKR